MVERISSMDAGYQTGELSVFPLALDDYQTLYRATNNAIVPLRQTLTYNGNRVIVDDTSLFPADGIIRVGPNVGLPGSYEEIYYGSKTGNTFEDLIRGFAGSQQGQWSASDSFVSNAVFAEHHNAEKDAILNMEADLGVKVSPDPNSLNGILTQQEIRFLAPKPLFRAFPISGPPPLNVRFQNFTTGYVIRYLWDFGDGGTSLEKSPNYTYIAEGTYTVKLNIVTSTGAQGVATKIGYINVSKDDTLPFFYVDSTNNPYSQKTATQNHVSPKTFVFVDQTDGDIVQRNWVFGDGTSFTQSDPDIHDVTHVYAAPGTYLVSELIQFANGRLQRADLPQPLVVL